VSHFLDILPHLIAMSVLIACSAFFSGSEAALFFLRPRERRQLRQGTPADRAAARLLNDPDRLLSAVLFWNLVINVSYFAIASIAAIDLGRGEAGNQLHAVVFAFVSLLAIIFFSEMLPKTLAVLSARRIASLVGIPLSITVRAVDPLMPGLRTITLLSRRLILPRFVPEPYLEVTDLERAIEISETDASLTEQERQVLHNIVSLSDVRVDEWMRPRMQFVSFRPPVMLADLEGQLTPSGYLLITDPDNDEVAGAIALKHMSPVGPDRLERHAEPVIYLPWCTSVATALNQMVSRDREVAAVINELGETVGILTYDDLLNAIFTTTHESGLRPAGREAIRSVSEDVWEVTGMISLRRLARRLGVTVPSSRSVTVSGILQDLLQRLPQNGDSCQLGPLQFDVVDAPERGQLLVRVTLTKVEENGE
jgi:CBS domain containing-hemolysin-like protein